LLLWFARSLAVSFTTATVPTRRRRLAEMTAVHASPAQEAFLACAAVEVFASWRGFA